MTCATKKTIRKNSVHHHHAVVVERIPTPCDLRVEYKVNPLGMDEAVPRFSYQLYGLQAQTARQLQVFKEKELVWDSGWVDDGRSLQINCEGLALEPFTRYNWRVRVKDEAGKVSQWNPEPAWFETGFLGTAWSNSNWIFGKGGSSYSLPPQLLRREFQVPRKKLLSARLYATALGLYEAEINGQVVSEDIFTPGWTDYYSRVQYQAYDVTELLKKGNNVFHVTLATGWFQGRISHHWSQGVNHYPWKNTSFRCELRLTFADGTVEVIGSDKEFKAYTLGGPIRMSDIYDGEICDATRTRQFLEQTEPLHAAGIDENCQVPITWHSGPKTRRLQTRRPESITRRGQGCYIVDFGQNLTGRERFTLHNAPKGASIIVRHAEMLNDDGSIYVANLRTARAMTVYSACGSAEETYEPSFTFYGFRYLEISGWPGKLTADDIEAVVISSDLPRTGLFSCSDPLINTLYDCVGWGMRSNFLDVPTDCPQRDERYGWTGDTQVFCNTATFNVFAPEFYSKWITDLNAQQSDDGTYPAICPNPFTKGNNGFTTGWTDAAIVVPWNLYQKYGDTRLLERYFANMDLYIQGIVKSTKGTYIADCAKFKDWLNLEKEPISGPMLSTSYLAGMVKLLESIAVVLKRDEDAKRLKALHAKVVKAYRKAFVDADGNLKESAQTAYLTALHFDLLPEKNRPAAVAALVKSIRKTHNTHLATGFLGTPLLLPVLTRFGELDLAYELLCQTSYPSWLYPITQGGTTMWERWNSYTKDDGFGSVSMNSFNHYAYGAVAEWFFETIGGIVKPIDGYKHFTLAPKPGKLFNNAEVVFLSPYGMIASAWQRNTGATSTLTWEFTVPDNTTATIILPYEEIVEFSGSQELKHDNDGNLLAAPGEYFITFKE